MIGMRHLNSKDGFDFHSIYFVQFFYAVASHLRLLLFQIDDRKDVCLVAVAPPIEKLQRLSMQSFFGSFLSISAVRITILGRCSNGVYNLFWWRRAIFHSGVKTLSVIEHFLIVG
ncbi:hypothetical protein POPTR_015G074450v4 [Populus trichocarpa]|uniref:Uncharacterized protein n=1 Tax=Populus trichocarpa TaxID=3694 RepID=A0ACC0RW44_POPTR|nr:hypothetical protein POPTR_015G074450v4 [Populus trichocarpa]